MHTPITLYAQHFNMYGRMGHFTSHVYYVISHTHTIHTHTHTHHTHTTMHLLHFCGYSKYENGFNPFVTKGSRAAFSLVTPYLSKHLQRSTRSEAANCRKLLTFSGLVDWSPLPPQPRHRRGEGYTVLTLVKNGNRIILPYKDGVHEACSGQYGINSVTARRVQLRGDISHAVTSLTEGRNDF